MGDEDMNLTISLEDICFQPYKTDNNTNCTIISVLNYFQNSLENLHKIKEDDWGFIKFADYIDHMKYCFSNYSSQSDGNSTWEGTDLGMSCLGTFGGPIHPEFALKGYSGDKYINATSLVITFVNNNLKDDEFLKKSMLWESACLEFLKNYTSENINISFSAGTAEYENELLKEKMKELEEKLEKQRVNLDKIMEEKENMIEEKNKIIEEKEELIEEKEEECKGKETNIYISNHDIIIQNT